MLTQSRLPIGPQADPFHEHLHTGVPGRIDTDNPTNPSGRGILRVALDASGSGNNESGIGSTVTTEVNFNGATVTQSRTVDGGSGRGSQESSVVALGVGDASGITVSVTWPDGYVQQKAAAELPQDPSDPVVFVDDHYPLVVNTTVTGSYTPGEGSTMWSFEWDTSFSATHHEISILPVNGSLPECSLVPKGAFVLDGSTSGASLSTSFDKAAGRFHHVLQWNRECDAPCSYRYTVKSYSAGRQSAAAEKILSIPVCGQIQG